MKPSQRNGLAAVLALIAIALVIWRCRGHESTGGTSNATPGSATATAPTGGRSTAATTQRPDPAKLAKASIAGTIRADDTKAALSGVQVCAGGESRDYADELLREASCTRSDASGHYLIDGLYPAQYTISAGGKPYRPEVYHPGGDRHVTSFPLRAGDHKTGVDLALRTGGVEIVGTVSDLTGGPIAKAHVSSAAPIVTTETDDKGAFSLWVGKGQHEITATADGYADGRDYLFAPGKSEILLTPESSLAGTVVDAKSGQPVEGARVTLGDWSEAETTFSDAQGAFRISRISPGRQTITARTDRGYGRTEGSTLVGLGQHVDGVVVKLFPAARIEARIVISGDPELPCERPRASLQDAAAQRWIELRKEPDGLLWAEGVLPGDYKPVIGCDGYQPRESYDHVIITQDSVKNLVWQVDAGAVIKGKIRTTSGEPIDDAEIWARTTSGAARAKTGWGGDRSGRDGSYELTGLKPGSYKIEVTTTRGLAPKDGFRVDVAAGATVEKDLVLEDGGTLSGTVVDANGVAVGGINISTRLVSGGGGRSWGGNHSTDDAGAFTIEGLRPGDYRVMAQRGWSDTLRKPGTTDDARQGERATVRVNQVATVKLVVEAQSGIIKGSVSDSDGSAVSDAFVSAARESDAAGAQRTNVSDTRWSWQDKPVLTGVDGAFKLDKLSPGTYTLRAFRKGGGEAIAEHIEVGATAKLQIKPTGSIEGIAKGPGGPPDELSISLNDPATGFWRSEDFFRTDGRFVIRDLPKGHFKLRAESAGITKELELELAEGEAKKGVNLDLEALITLTGKLVELGTGKPVPGVHTGATTPDGGGFSFSSSDEENVSDEAGAFTIKNAPRGKVMIRGMPKDWRDSEYAMLYVQKLVPETGSTFDLGTLPMIKKRVKQGDPVGELGINFVEQPPATPPDKHEYKVSWIDPVGPAAKSGLAVSDVITTIDGTDVTGAASQTGWVLMRAPPGTKLSIGLARGTTVFVSLAAP